MTAPAKATVEEISNCRSEVRSRSAHLDDLFTAMNGRSGFSADAAVAVYRAAQAAGVEDPGAKELTRHALAKYHAAISKITQARALLHDSANALTRLIDAAQDNPR